MRLEEMKNYAKATWAVVSRWHADLRDKSMGFYHGNVSKSQQYFCAVGFICLWVTYLIGLCALLAALMLYSPVLFFIGICVGAILFFAALMTHC